MRVLVVGSGAREHALCWSLTNQHHKVWCAPGNYGTSLVASNVPIAATHIYALVKFARATNIDMVIPGSEVSLCSGITDAMSEARIACFGPSRLAAQLEGSKAYTKQLCKAEQIPTAEWSACWYLESAVTYIRKVGAPLVIKADGLAAGKGVIMAETEAHAIAAARSMLEGQAFGNSGSRIVIEQRLVGREVSFFALCNGNKAEPFGAACDYKRLHEGSPLNTGGMGAYTDPAFFTPAMQSETMERIILPTLSGMAKREQPFQGILYAGLMLTDDGIKLIEFNVRFGDPEFQALAMCIDFDLAEVLHQTLRGTIPTPRLRSGNGIAVVMATRGYPEAPQTGSEIRSLAVPPDVQVFHAATEATPGGRLIASGGRVLSVCSRGADLDEARKTAYQGIAAIDWPDGFCRDDIGA